MCKIDGERPLFRIGGILVLDCVVHGVRHPICRLDSRLLELVRALHRPPCNVWLYAGTVVGAVDIWMCVSSGMPLFI